MTCFTKKLNFKKYAFSSTIPIFFCASLLSNCSACTLNMQHSLEAEGGDPHQEICLNYNNVVETEKNDTIPEHMKWYEFN